MADDRYHRVRINRTAHFASLSIVLGGACLAGAVAYQGRSDRAKGNIALRKPYRLTPPPSYKLCTDPDDRLQLTDGVIGDSNWRQLGTVGWRDPPTPPTVLIDLGMVEGKPVRPAYQAWITKTTWVRAAAAGILQFHVTPGEMVDKAQPVATIASLLGREQSVVHSPAAGIVLGMTTLPSVAPGGPVCHIAVPRGGLERISRAQEALPEESLHERLRDDLATNVAVSEPGTGQRG